MEAERWRQVEELYHSARGAGPSALVDVAPDLRLEVEMLLRQDASDGPLDRPIAHLAGRDNSKEFAVGVQLGPYRIEERLGAGGMGEVFRAIDTRLGRDVAIKKSLEQFGERFHREAKAISALNHPYICTLYDVGPDYLVMEFVDGKTLAAQLERGKLSLEQTMQYGSQIADALAAAHSKGIVHRDLKPGNIMLSKPGIKILDFGLAKSLQDENSAVSQTLMGTPAYMAPEQREGKNCDPRSDIYSFGLVLREMAIGRCETKTAPLPRYLAHIVDRCLKLDPEERWQTASDVRRELDWAAESTSGTTEAPRGSSRVRAAMPWAAAGLVSCLALVLLARTLWRGNTEQALTYRQVTFHRGSIGVGRFAPGGETIIYDASWEGKASDIFESELQAPESRALGLPNSYLAAVTNSGELLVLQKHHAVSTRVWYDTATLARVALTGGTPREVLEDVYAADLSADGSDLAVMQLKGVTLNVQFPLGTTICRIPLADKPSFRIAPDGKTLAIAGPAQSQDRLSLFRKGSQGGKAIAAGYRVSSVAWLSERELVFSGSKFNDNDFELLENLNRRTPRVLARFPYDFQIQDVWNGRRFLLKAQHDQSVTAFHGKNGRELNLSWLDHTHVNGLTSDGGALLLSELGQGGGRAGSAYLRKTDGSPATKLGAGRGFALSPDGRWAVMQPADRSGLTLISTAAGPTYTLELPRATSIQSARWFPDGTHLALNLVTGQGLDCYVQGLQGAQPRGLPHQIPHLNMPCFAISPDGRSVAVMNEGAPPQICRIADGGTEPLLGSAPGERPLSFSGDGKFLYVAKFGESPARATLFRIEIKTGRRQFHGEISPADLSGVPRIDFVFITPDGRQLAYGFHRILNELFVAETH